MDVASTVPLRTGRAMPVMGLGTWQLTDDTAATVDEALRLGYPMIDTAGDYGTQPGIGEALRRTGIDRDDVYIVAKVEEDEDALSAVRRNLDEMGIDRADLFLLHRPPPEGPGVALWEGLLRARDDGLARDVGVSNYSVGQMQALAVATGELPAVDQVEWSPFGWSPELLDWCRERGVVVQAYSPLTRARRLDDPRLAEVAAACGATPAQVVLRWNLQLGTVPLPKANRREHLVENLGALEVELDEDAMDRLGRLDERWSSLGPRPEYL